MEDRYLIEARHASTGYQVYDSTDPVRFSPERHYQQSEPDGRGRFYIRTVIQVLAYDGDDRKWFDTFDEAQAVIQRFTFPSVDEYEFDGRQPRPCEVRFWDYDATEWKYPACDDPKCPIHHPAPCAGEACEGCVQCFAGGAFGSSRERFHADGGL